MPEIYTKYPEVVIKLLAALPGVQIDLINQPQQREILKSCPRGSFIKLPGGELCVYHISQLLQSTQINKQELRTICSPTCVLGT